MESTAKKTLDLIAFSHSIFALPFALVGMLYAAHSWPNITLVSKIILAVIFARTAAMAFNRLVDAKYDALNPRTRDRHLATGTLSKQYVFGLILFSSIAFILTAYSINSLSFILSPLALFILFFYSLSKRFSHLTQIFLGISLGIAPVAASIAVTNQVTFPPIILGLSVMFWVAGFDLLYANQDYEFDKKTGLKSLVVALGPEKSILLARTFHVLFFFGLLYFAYLQKLNWIAWTGSILVGLLIISEHFIFDLKDPKKINKAFFTMNGFISLLYFVFIFLDKFLL